VPTEAELAALLAPVAAYAYGTESESTPGIPVEEPTTESTALANPDPTVSDPAMGGYAYAELYPSP
jgi:hypothetical protein